MRFCAVYIGFLFSFVCQAQTDEFPHPVIRSAFGISSLQQDDKQSYIVQQSVGQSGIIGDYTSGDYIISQGFVQTSLLPVRRHKKAKPKPSIEVYPNPFDKDINISFSEFSEAAIQIAVYNALGHLLASYEYEPIQHLSIRLGHLPPGNYILHVRMNDESIFKQIIKLT